MTHDELRDLCAVHALGALDGEERAAMEAHLEECAECRRLVAEHAEAAAGMSAALRPLEPSPELRRRIEDAVHATSGPRLVFTRKAPPSWAVPAAAAAALLAGTWFGYKLEEANIAPMEARLAKINESYEKLAKQMDPLKSEVAELRAEKAANALKLAELEKREAAFMAEARVAQMKGGVGNAALGKVFWKGEEVHVMAAGLKPLSPGKGYQLWTIVEGQKPKAAGARMMEMKGDSIVGVLKVAGMPADKVVFAVTQEDKDNAETPTGPLHLEPGELK